MKKGKMPLKLMFDSCIRLFFVLLLVFPLGIGCSGGSSDDNDSDSTHNNGNTNSESSISIDSGYLQYRTYENSSNNGYRGWLSFTDNGSSIIESDITQIVLKDSHGSNETIINNGFYAGAYFWGAWDEDRSGLVFSGPFNDSGFSIGFPLGTSLSDENYTYEATTSEGNVLTLQVYFPGETTMPLVESSNIGYAWQADGSLKISWSNPTGAYDQLRVYICDQDWNDIAYIRPSNSAEDLIIPSEWIKKMTTQMNPNSAKIQIQTRNIVNTTDGNNYARGYSEAIDIPWNGASTSAQANSIYWVASNDRHIAHYRIDQIDNLFYCYIIDWTQTNRTGLGTIEYNPDTLFGSGSIIDNDYYFDDSTIMAPIPWILSDDTVGALGSNTVVLVPISEDTLQTSLNYKLYDAEGNIIDTGTSSSIWTKAPARIQWHSVKPH